MLDDLWTNLLAASFWMPILGQVAGDASGRLAAAGLRAVAVEFVVAPARRRPAKRAVPRFMRLLVDLIWADERRRPKRSPRRLSRRAKRRVTKTKERLRQR